MKLVYKCEHSTFASLLSAYWIIYYVEMKWHQVFSVVDGFPQPSYNKSYILCERFKVIHHFLLAMLYSDDLENVPLAVKYICIKRTFYEHAPKDLRSDLDVDISWSNKLLHVQDGRAICNAHHLPPGQKPTTSSV